MAEPTIEALQRELGSLKRSNRVAWCLILLIGAATYDFRTDAVRDRKDVLRSLKEIKTTGQSSSSVIRAERFELFDEKGVSRGWFGLDRPDGSGRRRTSLLMFAPDRDIDEPGGVIDLAVNGAGVKALFESEFGTVKIESTPVGASASIQDQSGADRAVLGSVGLSQKDGTQIRKPGSSLTLFDEEGKVTWSAR